MRRDTREKRREAASLEEPAAEARALARRLGLDPYRVKYWIVDHDEMNELIAYGGFQTRYPHWRWGMQYDRQRKSDQYLGGKAFEIVNNDDPAHAFLQASNSRADQKAVITHVEAHADFFANNEWFGLFGESAAPRAADEDSAAPRAADEDSAAPRAADEDSAAPRAADDDSAAPRAADEDSAAPRAADDNSAAPRAAKDDSTAVPGANGERAERAGGPNAAAMLERHARSIQGFLEDPGIEQGAVERWIDTVLCLEDDIEHRRAFDADDGSAEESHSLPEALDGLDVSEEVRTAIFGDEWRDARDGEEAAASRPPEPAYDLLAFLAEFGKQYDDDAGKAVEMEPWQREILELLRRESYYFAPQKMTKVMNEGWAAYWESTMMAGEAFADDEEFLDYADHQARVLNSPGFNPYSLGKELWEYVENSTNRREVVEQLLRVEGVTWRNFHDAVDLGRVLDLLEPAPAIDAIAADSLDALDDVDQAYVDQGALARAKAGEVDVDRYPWKVLTRAGLAARHYSLVQPAFRGFLSRISRAELERVSRYLFEDERHSSVEDAIAAVDRSAGWDRMFAVRASHNDVTFVDEFLTQEFVDANDYFTYEFSHAHGDFRATSTEAADVKKKLLLRFTNLGKPTIGVRDANYENRGELLLGHEYNGVVLDLDQAKETLKRVFELWGRPVVLRTITKEITEHEMDRARRRNEEPVPEEIGIEVRYDGDGFETTDLPWSAVEDLAASDLDYDTKPDDWL